MATLNYDLSTRRGCMLAVVDMRHSCRVLTTTLDLYWQDVSMARRTVRKLRSTGNPFMARRADAIESEIQGASEVIASLKGQLRGVADKMFMCAPYIDAMLPQSVLLDLLNVNHVDRSALTPEDDLTQIVFAHALENSAENRHKDWNDSAMFRAVHLRFAHALATNAEFERVTTDMLFGPGGMFEFVPRVEFLSDGTARKLPPPLRIADPSLDAGERWRDE